MTKLYFMNKGAFDVSAMLTFGVSAKETDDAIGYFGTGFKYAIAIILRLGGSISVLSCGERFKFTCKEKVIRGKPFSIVSMNGVEAGFTTHLGANWKPWQAFRELYSNVLDEGGSVSTKRGRGFDTVITVDCPEILDSYQNRELYFLESKPIYSDGTAEIHEGEAKFHYFKGIAVADAKDSEFTFNILRGVDLTEDRSAKYPGFDIIRPVMMAIQSCDDDRFISKILTSKGRSDVMLPYEKSYKTSEAFLSACRNLMNKDRDIPECARRVLFESDKVNGDWPEIELSAVNKAMLSKAAELLHSIGVPSHDYPIKVVKGLGDDCMGRAFNETIYLSSIPFELGTKQVAGTILEEYVHLKHGCHDFDRQMQNWLFNKVISLGEELTGEPV